jgi:hypothetical protein
VTGNEALRVLAAESCRLEVVVDGLKRSSREAISPPKLFSAPPPRLSGALCLGIGSCHRHDVPWTYLSVLFWLLARIGVSAHVRKLLSNADC